MRRLDDWLKAYLQYTQNNEAPEHFHFWGAVGVLGAALRKKVYVDMGDWQWSPNFYIIFVAEPGIVNKSTTMRIGEELLPTGAIHIGPSSITWQALIEAFAEAQEDVVMPDGMLMPMSCLSFFVSELGTFIDFSDRKMIDVLVDLWDGHTGSWTRRTQARGHEAAVNPWINMVAGTTPAWLAENLPRKMISGGFSSRCIWVHGSQKKAYIPYPTRHKAMDGRAQLKADLEHDLGLIAAMRGEFRLTEEAYQYGEHWYIEHCRHMEQSSSGAAGLGGYYARKQAHAHKLAIVLSAARRDNMRIERADLEAAVKILEANEYGYGQVFQSIVTPAAAEQTLDLVKIVIAKGKIRKSELYQMVFRTMDGVKTYNEALESATAAGYLNFVQQGSSLFIVPGPEVHKISGSLGKGSSTSSSEEDHVA